MSAAIRSDFVSSAVLDNLSNTMKKYALYGRIKKLKLSKYRAREEYDVCLTVSINERGNKE